MTWHLTETVAPTIKALELSLVKQHLRVYSGDDDSYLDNQLIPAVVYFAQEQTGRQLAPATYRLDIDDFPRRCKTIKLPRPPLSAVSSITYVDADGATQTLSSSLYTVHIGIEPGEVRLKHDQVWPSVRQQNLAVSVTYTCGYTFGNVPTGITQAMLMLTNNLYDNRSDAIIGANVSQAPTASMHLLESHKVGDAYENWEQCQDRYSIC